ncbi:MAG: Uncharacterized protein JWR17_1866 [Pseudomonas sp.]|uniref:hypothetical protein n=1 Tax=Pseudomonas sp. TaxID=306 RepID=UPI00260BFBDB|nr:hypothetical protein [Pseudomonas sp.]MDB6049120.1 Uncharacterized protein [Pseudomonas sp.]
MTSQRFAQLRISPLHIQQGLFASLALLVTLVVGQQFQRWDTPSANVHVSQRVATAHIYSVVSAAPSTAQSRNAQSAQATAPVLSEQAHTQTWVF